MNHADISTLERPIIGTHSLATCLGILLYDEDNRRAIVAHASAGNPIPALDELFTIIYKNKLYDIIFKYKIFSGYYCDAAKGYNSYEIIKDHFKNYIPFNEEDIPIDANLKSSNYEANEFYFNALTGRFVTSDVLSVKENNSNIRTR